MMPANINRPDNIYPFEFFGPVVAVSNEGAVNGGNFYSAVDEDG
jgi:hypothetical protein